MNKIKFFALLLSLSMILAALAGCGGNPSDNETTSGFGTKDQLTEAPTENLTEAPTKEPTEAPTEEPTEVTTEESTDAPTEEPTTETPTEAPTEEPTEEPTTEEPTTETETESETETLPYDIYANDLSEEMQYLFAGDTVKNESVMFLDYGDEKKLMFKADEIISVTSYGGQITYTEGVDYELVDGKIRILEGSSIPCITRAVFYNNETNSSTLTTKYNGEKYYTYWGEGTTMTQWQVNVTYKHSDSWDKFTQDSNIDIYKSFLDKLAAGEDVTIVFYGDSITRGANSSFFVNTDPYQYSYPMLFTYTLADLFGYTVTHGYTWMNKTFGAEDEKPHELITDYVAGDRGKITLVNASVGGWASGGAAENCQAYVLDHTAYYGCDLFIYAFGMNDAGTGSKNFQTNMKKVVDAVVEKHPETSVMLVSTMVPNINAVGGWYGNQPTFEEPMIASAASYTRGDIPCAVACVTSMSLAILENKDFHDYAANNINHPNDFFSRVYAQTLFQTLIGYENLK